MTPLPTRPGGQALESPAGNTKVFIVLPAYNEEANISGLLQMLREGHDVVIASRYQPGARVIGLSLPRRIASYGASWLFRMLFPTPGLRDYTCGFRAYRGKVLSLAVARYGSRFVDTEGFQCMVDILLKLRKLDV